MRTILNLVWLVTSGIWLALAYCIAGVVACIFIVTIPFGIASFRMARFALWPFGRSVIEPESGTNAIAKTGNVLWFVIAGLWLAIGHVTTAAVQFVSIIGIPLAIGNLKMLPVTCFPLGRSIAANDRIPFGYRQMVSL